MIEIPASNPHYALGENRKSSNCSGEFSMAVPASCNRRLSVMDALHVIPHNISNAADLHYPPKRRPSAVEHVIRLSPRRSSAVQRTSLIESIEESPQSSPRSSVCGSGSRKVSLRLDGRIRIPTDDFHSVDLHLDLGEMKRGRSLSCYGAYLPHKITVTGDTVQIHQREPDSLKHKQGSFSHQLRQMKNLIILAFSYMLVFVGFNALRGLQSTLSHTEKGSVGLISLCTFYSSMTLTGVLSSAVTNKLTPKWTVVVAFIFYTAYVAANLHAKAFTLIPASILAGFMSGPLWNAQTLYLYSTSRKYAFLTEELAERVLNRFNRIFGAIFHCSTVIGNTVAYILFSNSKRLYLPSNPQENSTYNVWGESDDVESKNTSLCGAQTCITNTSSTPVFVIQYVGQQVDSSVLLISIYIGCSLLGTALGTALLDRLEPSLRESPRRKSVVRLLLRMVKALLDGRILCLSLLLIFTGLEQGFIFADFTKVGQLLILFV